ncbi:MAG: hypothetical protein AB1567_06945 [bacterium]
MHQIIVLAVIVIMLWCQVGYSRVNIDDMTLSEEVTVSYAIIVQPETEIYYVDKHEGRKGIRLLPCGFLHGKFSVGTDSVILIIGKESLKKDFRDNIKNLVTEAILSVYADELPTFNKSYNHSTFTLSLSPTATWDADRIFFEGKDVGTISLSSILKAILSNEGMIKRESETLQWVVTPNGDILLSDNMGTFTLSSIWHTIKMMRDPIYRQENCDHCWVATNFYLDNPPSTGYTCKYCGKTMIKRGQYLQDWEIRKKCD